MANSLDSIGQWKSSKETHIAVKEEKRTHPLTRSGGSTTVCNIFDSDQPELMALALKNCNVHSGKSSEQIVLKVGNDIIDITDIQDIYNKVTFKIMLYDKSTKFSSLLNYILKSVSISDPIYLLNEQMKKYNNNIQSFNESTYKNNKIICTSDLNTFLKNSLMFLEDCICYSDCISYYICHCYGNCNYY